MKFRLLILMSLALCACASSSTISSSLVESSSAASTSISVESSSEPSSSNERVTYRWSLPIRTVIPGGPRDKPFIWGDHVLEPYLMDHLKDSDLRIGNVVTLEFSCTGYFVYESMPSTLDIFNYKYHSVSIQAGEMVEVDIKDGVPDLDSVGLNQPHDPFTYAINEEGKDVSLSSLEKVYAGVSKSEPALLCGFMTYPFR